MNKKVVLGIAVSALLAATTVVTSAAGFAKPNTYTPGMFGDVPQTEWYASSVSSAYELGFMKGTADGVFSPSDTMTVAEAITVASRVHDAYNAKGTEFAGGTNWYDPYVSYAEANGIIEKGAFGAADFDRPVKRYEMAVIFASAVPESFLEARNDVNEIPDVPSTNAYFDKLRLLYNAGVVMGNDEFGSFKPNNNIIRAEAAAIIGRVALPENRLTKTLVDGNYGDAFYLINHYDATTFGLNAGMAESPWNYDNRNRVGTVTNLANNVDDFYEDGSVVLWRDIDDVTEGLLGMDFSGSTSGSDGLYIKITDDDLKEVFALSIVDKKWSFNGKDTGVATKDGTVKIGVRADLDKNNAELYIDGKKIGVYDIADGVTASRVTLGCGEKETGTIIIERIDVFKDYVVNDIFLVPTGSELSQWEVTGEAVVVQKNGKGEFDYNSAEMKAGAVAKKTFNMPITGNVVFETYMLAPKAGDTGSIALRSGDTAVATIKVTDDGIVKADGTKLRHHTNNIWQTLRMEVNTSAGTVLYKVNGKKVGEFAMDAVLGSVDNIVVTADSGTICFDDVEVYLTHEYDDYCPVPVPITDDGYDVILNICSLWREGSHFGWGAITAHEDIEPVLGYYDEGIVETADWEIKMWVENGIDVAHFCWYSPSGDIKEPIKKSNMNDALHDGFFNAKYSDMMKFTFMWENTGTNCYSLEQFKEYIWSYWMDYYFLDERFYAPDGYITFTVWSYNNFRKAFGDTNEGAQAAVAFMNEDAKAHGFNGVRVWFADQHAQDAGSFGNMAAVGGSAAYAYHWQQDGIYASNTTNRLQKNQDYGKIHVVPTVSVGFNNIGWSGIRKNLATLDDHRTVLEYIKDQYLPAAEGWKSKTLIVSTWNEYGEGTYVMPVDGLHGFGYLENVAEVISGVTDHSNNIRPTEQQKARLGHLWPDSKTSLLRYDYEKAEEMTDDSIKLVVDKVTYTPAFNPTEKGGEIYIAAEPKAGFFSLNNIYYEWNRFTGKLRLVTPNDREVIFTMDSNIVLVDGKEQTLSEKVVLRDGLPVLPLFWLYKISEIPYEYKDKTVTVNTIDEKYEEVINNRVAYQYEFDVPGDIEGFKPGYVTIAVKDGFLVGTAVERAGQNPPYDPMFNMTGIEINTLECNKMVIGMKHKLQEGKESASLQVFFATKTSPNLSEDKSAVTPLKGKESTEVVEYVMDFSNNENWTGVVNAIRVDPFYCGGSFEIDYIRFIIDEELAKKNAEIIAQQEKEAKERLEKGIVIVNGDADDDRYPKAFAGEKGNAIVERIEDEEDEDRGLVWKVTPDGNGQIWAYARQTVTYVPGTTYDVSVDIKYLGYNDDPSYVAGQVICNTCYVGKDGKVDHIVDGARLAMNNNDGWMTYTFQFTIPADSTDRSKDQFCFYSNPEGGKGTGFMFDNLTVQKAAE